MFARFSFCNGEGEQLPTPVTQEQLACLVNIVGSQEYFVATGFLNDGTSFVTDDGLLTAPAELEGTDGPAVDELRECVAINPEEVKLERFFCTDVEVFFVCELVA